MKGRHPKPTRLRELEGNPGKRAYNKLEPKPEAPGAEFDRPPRELWGKRESMREWRRLAPVLRRARQITAADRGALIAACLEWGRYLEALAGIEALVIEGRLGVRVQHPLNAVASKSLAGCIRLWEQLGCTPSARSRVSTAPGLAAPAPDDPFAAAFDGEPIGELEAPAGREH